MGMPDEPDVPEAPAPPPPKPMPITESDAEIEEANRDTRKEQLRNFSRNSTLLAGKLGGSNQNENTSLLGG